MILNINLKRNQFRVDFKKIFEANMSIIKIVIDDGNGKATAFQSFSLRELTDFFPRDAIRMSLGLRGLSGCHSGQKDIDRLARCVACSQHRHGILLTNNTTWRTSETEESCASSRRSADVTTSGATVTGAAFRMRPDVGRSPLRRAVILCTESRGVPRIRR